MALIDSAVSVTIRHNDNAATASEAATALVKRAEATRIDRSPKPIPETGDRVIGRKSLKERRITTRLKISGFAGNNAAARSPKMAEARLLQQNQVVMPAIPRAQRDQASAVSPVSVAGTVPGAETSAGFQVMDTNRGSCSTRFNQARTDG